MWSKRGPWRIKVGEEQGWRHGRPAISNRVIDRALIRQQKVVLVVRIFAALDDHSSVGQDRLSARVADEGLRGEFGPCAVHVTAVDIRRQLEDPGVLTEQPGILNQYAAIGQQEWRARSTGAENGSRRVDAFGDRRRVLQRLPRARRGAQ